MVTRFDPPAPQRVVEREGDGGRRGVAVLVDNHRGPFLGDAESLTGGLDDPKVRLVGDAYVEVRGGQARVTQRLLGRIDDDPYRSAEHLLPLHGEEAVVLAVQQMLERAVCTGVPAEQVARPLHRLEDDGAGP